MNKPGILQWKCYGFPILPLQYFNEIGQPFPRIGIMSSEDTVWCRDGTVEIIKQMY